MRVCNGSVCNESVYITDESGVCKINTSISCKIGSYYLIL